MLRNRGNSRQTNLLVQLKLSKFWFWWEKNNIKKLKINWKYLRDFVCVKFCGHKKNPEISRTSIIAVDCITFAKFSKYSTPKNVYPYVNTWLCPMATTALRYIIMHMLQWLQHRHATNFFTFTEKILNENFIFCAVWSDCSPRFYKLYYLPTNKVLTFPRFIVVSLKNYSNV